ncbi:UvrD-helicase domain-containing protein [Polaribacter sp. Hel_I_88]|uniref:UvrD-helicase domain-containing protein n=1 Tax=Polaribacter sp. Hel_I_88 TaxID=1250006 RepID=UPI000479DF51|nr:UvrD-helicase domain-containing protein [Polaribacter sp. Hel_I_88]
MTNTSPAEIAALQSLEKIYTCIRDKKSFILEAGAGAGKTYSLNKSLSYILDDQGIFMQRSAQQVACITYTNIAADNFTSTQNNHPALFSGTIHSFCWMILSKFQSELRKLVLTNEKLIELLEEDQNINDFNIEYDFGYRKKEDFILKIHHDDVINFTIEFLKNKKFLKYLSSIFPIILIDEYQDTNEQLVDSILENIVKSETEILIGFFGDSWQKIYGDGCGEINDSSLEVVKKQSNFRSEKNIVETLNKIRPNLQQEVVEPQSSGSIRVYTSNNWTGGWETRNHWQGALPSNQASINLNKVREILKSDEGWTFDNENTKTLMLTHRVLGIEQGYEDIVSAFRYNDSFIKKQDKHIAYFLDVIEPLRELFEQGKYGEMFKLLGRKFPHIKTISDKKDWNDSLTELFQICDNGSVEDVVKHIMLKGKPIIDSGILRREEELNIDIENENELSSSQKELRKLKVIEYSQVRALSKFISGYTPFSTQHGVKGDEFENVLVVFGRGWNQYDWDKFLGLSNPENSNHLGQEDFYIRNRNLFYVACSRPIKNLTLLFTQRLSIKALETLVNWFGEDKITHL